MTSLGGRVGSILDAIGHTPLVPLNRLGKGLPYDLLAKLEFLNPGGSVKDRIGPAMIDAAEREGRLKPHGTIVEATSGNTGVGLALVAAVRGYRCVFVLPDKMSSEKIRLLRALGARVVITPSGVPPEHPSSHYSVAKRLAKEIPGAYYPDQYSNAQNPEAHYRTTGPEIDRDAGEKLSAVILTVGTGGTITGVGRYFREHRPDVKIVGVDPIGSVLAPFWRTKEIPRAVPYKVEGIGEDKVPGTVDVSVIDAFVQVGDRESFLYARRLAREEGLFAGGSSGSAVAGALSYLRDRPVPEGSTVVVLLPDSGDRYLSRFYSDDWMRENRFLDEAATVGALLVAKQFARPLVSVSPTTTVRDALAMLEHHGISQLPVLDGSENVGSVLEQDLLRAVLSDQTTAERSVSTLLGPPFGEVGQETPVGDVLHRLKQERALLVRNATTQEPMGLVTRHDLLAHYSEGGAPDAV